METTIHLVMETPGANAYQILSEATQDDEPKPIFIFPKNQQKNQFSWKISDDHTALELPIKDIESSEVFIFLSHNTSLTDQIEATMGTLKNDSNLTIGRFILFLYSPILLSSPRNFYD